MDEKIDVSVDPDAFRTAVVAFFGARDAVFELRAQLWTDAKTQPLEDTSVEWLEAESPFVTIATLRLPRQAAYSAARQRYFDDVMTFRPAHSLEAHRPLGSVMRAGLNQTRQDVLDYARQTIDLIVQVGRRGGKRGVLQVYMPVEHRSVFKRKALLVGRAHV